MMSFEELSCRLSKFGQQHLLQFWNDLTASEKEELVQDINEIDFATVIRDFQSVMSGMKSDGRKYDYPNIEPVPQSLFGNANQTSAEQLKRFEQKGLELISGGKVAVLVLAGGQGTRLGVTYPKGMYDVGLPSHKTLFQIQAERICKLMELAKQHNPNEKSVALPWFVMTSESTLDPTLTFFENNKFFGLNRNEVFIFEQYLLPAFTFDGKVIMQQKHKISMSPDGNGGLYKALRDRGILDILEKRGIQYVHAFSIDNILVKVGDPVFLGYCVEHATDCGVKVIEKTVPEEAIGVVCKVNSQWRVVEYSEISTAAAEKRADDGSLVFKAGNICNHIFSTKFLRKIADGHISDLELHVATKKIPTIDSDGNCVKASQPNGVKMEKFIFDVFPFAEKMVVWQVEREDEFSALKNSDDAGKDCPATAKRDLFHLHKKWLLNAGAKFEEDLAICEISPWVSYGGEGLQEKVKGKTLKSPFTLKTDDN